MHYTYHGRLCGYVCSHCPEPLSNVKVRLYRLRDDQNAASLATAATKETLRPLSDDDAADKADYLLAESETDENGAFAVEFGDDYDGEPFEVDVYVESVPGGPESDAPPIQFTVTTLQPKWRDAEDGLLARWEYCLPFRVWCNIRARFDAWAICGTVVACDTKAPVGGVRVIAFDTDLTQDDTLGDGVTDATGRFRIDYSAKDFRRTPFSPWINVEWIGGPDVYFRVETTTGTPLLTEARALGRTPGRENAPHCLCVELCLKDVPDDVVIQTIPLFTHVGQYKVDSDPAVSDFTPVGTSKVGDFAFTDTIPLIGLIPDGTAADPVEYRFRYRELPAGLLTDADTSVLVTTKIGQLEYFAWNATLSVWQVKATDFYAGHGGAPTVSIPQAVGPPLVVSVNTPIKAGGWIEVPTVNALVPGGAGRFLPNSGELAALDTTKLSSQSFDLTVAAPPLPLEAGESVPPAQKAAKPAFEIVFEARKVAGGAPVNSNTLDVIAISNVSYHYTRHPYWAGGAVTTTAVVSLGIAEMVPPGGTGCDKLAGQLHALYTVYHPYMGDVDVWFEGNTPLPPALAPVVDAAGEAVQGSPGHMFDISGMQPCAYILWLRGTLLLTRGWGQIANPNIWDKIAFCIG